MTFRIKTLTALVVWSLVIAGARADDTLSAPPSPTPENSNDPMALVALAVKYEHAEGVPRDYNKAVALYCRAARSGNADAQYALGWMYANGRGVNKDDDIAAQLFAMAAEQGHAHASRMLRHTGSTSLTPLPSCLRPEEITTSTEPLPPLIDKNDLLAEMQSQEEALAFPPGPIYNLVHILAPRYEIDPRLALAVIAVESGFNARAVSSKNAQGLMQLIPETAQRFRVKNAFDPADNIKGGLAYLQWLLAFFKGNVPLVAAAYNSGEGTVEKYRGIPPYPETRDYVRKITRLYRNPTHPYQPNLVKAAAFVALP